MIITGTTGYENFEGRSSKCYLFALKVGPLADLPMQEINLTKACGYHDELCYQQVARIPAARGYPDNMGSWMTRTYDCPEGTWLKIHSQRRQQWNSIRIQANLLVKLRSSGPLIRITSQTSGWEKAELDGVCIEGRMDVKALEEATSEGYEVAPFAKQYFKEPWLHRQFTIVTLERETSAPPIREVRQITNLEGDTVEIVSTRKRRRIRL